MLLFHRGQGITVGMSLQCQGFVCSLCCRSCDVTNFKRAKKKEVIYLYRDLQSSLRVCDILGIPHGHLSSE